LTIYSENENKLDEHNIGLICIFWTQKTMLEGVQYEFDMDFLDKEIENKA
jgi:hypothetical protein